MSDLLQLPVTTLQGEPTTLGALADGKAALVVNVASRCGLTPQYATLEALHEEYAARGFTVIGVPCNQFGGQEPGTADEIAAFCSATYGVTFPMTGKVDVNGPDAPGEAGPVQWNFEKWLVASDGTVAGRFRPDVAPDAPEVRTAVEALLRG